MKRILAIAALSFSLLLSVFSAAFAWELERPGYNFTMGERNESSRTDGKASVGLGIEVAGYREN
jgi:hypothetical protein